MNTNNMILDRDGQPFSDFAVAEQVSAVLARETGDLFTVMSHGGGYGLMRQSRSSSTHQQHEIDDGNEFQAFWFRPAWRSQLGKVFSIALGLLMFGFSGQILTLLQIDRLAILVGDILKIATGDVFPLISIAVSLAGLLIAAMAAIRALYFIYSHHYYIGPWGIEANTELISRDQRRIEYRHIRGVNLRQSVIERLLGIGTLDIATSGAEDSDVQFLGVSNPNKLLGILRERLRLMA